GGRSGRPDRRAQATKDFLRRARRLRPRAERAARAVADGQCRAAAARRLRLGADPQRHEPARRRQFVGLGGRQKTPHAGAGDAVAAAADVRKTRMRFYLLFLVLALAGVTSAAAQTGAPPSDAANSMLGGWEMSNADHDKICIITFKLDAAGPGRALDLPG